MDTKKSIIYICQFAGTEKNGMNYRPYYLGKYAVKAGYRFIVVGSGFHHQMKEPKNLTKTPVYETIDGVEYIWMPSKKYVAENYFQRIISLFAFPASLWFYNIRRIVKDDSILAVVSSSPSLISSLPAIKWARRLKTKFIFEVRDIWPMSLVELSSVSERNPFIMFLKQVERKSYRKADRVFTVLSNAKDYMTENGMMPGKFRYIPNGVDALPENGSKTDNELDVDAEAAFKGKFVVGYAGTIGVANNLSNLIKAARLLKNESGIGFAIIGEGPKKAEIQEEASDLNNVFFIPAVRKDKINSYIRRLGAGYLGLRRARMFEFGISPNKLFEYMLGSVPVILAVNTTNSIVEKAGCGLVLNPDSPPELAEKIMALYKADVKERKKMGAAGLDFVSENHSYEKITEKFINSIIED